MKNVFLIMILMSFCASGYAFDKGQEPINIKTDNDSIMTSNKINIMVNSKVFRASLFDTDAAQGFGDMLPMTLYMKELNGDEKYHDLPQTLPTNATNPGETKSGDLMLFGSKTLVLFYKTSTTDYKYTPLGRIDDTSGLAVAVGSGDVSVTFENQQE